MRLGRARLRWAAAWVAGLVASFHGVGVSHATLGPIELISRADPSVALTGGGTLGGISADGRFVVFSSTATDLDHGQVDSNAATDVFLFDRLTQTTTLVSHIPGAPGTTGNGASSNPVISADGAYVAFISAATNLVPGTDTNGATDVFLYETATGTVTLVSHVPGDSGTAANGTSDSLVISADGAYVAFRSAATNLVPGTGDRRQSASPMILRSGSTNGQRGR